MLRTFIAIVWGMSNFISFNTMMAHADFGYILQEVFTLQTFWKVSIPVICIQHAYMWHINK